MNTLRLVFRAAAVIARRKHFKLFIAAATTLGLVVLAGVLLSQKPDEHRPTFCNVLVDPKPPTAARTWSFAFADDNLERLEGVRRELETRGYNFEQYNYRCTSWPCSDISLRMRKVEAHTPDSLRAREAELCELAKSNGLQMYWGVISRE